MLDSLDTLIAFVLIMLVVSLLITIAVQMLATVLNLRGWNLLIGLKNTFGVIAPDTQQGISRYAPGNRKNDKQRRALARYLLKGGLLSDSILPWWLTFWRHATAVRPGELFDAIHRIAIGKETATENLRSNAQSLLIALGVDKDALEAAAKGTTEAGKAAKTLTENAKSALESITDNNVRKKIEAAVDGAVSAAANEVKATAAKAAALGVSAAGTIDAAYEKFHYWTCICEERASQWVTMHTRILTVIFAFIFAFALQLDTVEIFKLVSSNKALREKLIAQSAAVASQAEKVVGSAADKTTADALQQHYAEVKADFANSGFALFPKEGVGSRWSEGWNTAHWLGVLFSVGLLSLGAPFWYHALKDLVSLRSQVAQNIAEQKDKPDAAAPTAPPTVKPPDDKQAKQAAMLANARSKMVALKSAQEDPAKLKDAIAELDSTLNPKSN